MANMELVPGRRYRIRYRQVGYRLDREIIAEFMDADNSTIRFSGRPQFGTASLNMRETEIMSVSPTTDRCHAPKVVR
jgi:hypothetical protein